jgi:hypothetical protein
MKLNRHVHIKELGSETMVFDSLSGELYAADPVSREIFKLLQNEISENEILTHIQSLYPENSKKTISDDVREFITTLKESKLLCSSS